MRGLAGPPRFEFPSNALYTVEGISENPSDTQKHLLTKITQAMERVELCEHSIPNSGPRLQYPSRGHQKVDNRKKSEIT